MALRILWMRVIKETLCADIPHAVHIVLLLCSMQIHSFAYCARQQFGTYLSTYYFASKAQRIDYEKGEFEVECTEIISLSKGGHIQYLP